MSFFHLTKKIYGENLDIIWKKSCTFQTFFYLHFQDDFYFNNFPSIHFKKWYLWCFNFRMSTPVNPDKFGKSHVFLHWKYEYWSMILFSLILLTYRQSGLLCTTFSKFLCSRENMKWGFSKVSILMGSHRWAASESSTFFL